MKKYSLIPVGWPCTLQECPPGVFWFNTDFGFKDEYGDAGNVFCLESGEFFWGGVKTKEERDKLIVQPIEIEVEDEE